MLILFAVNTGDHKKTLIVFQGQGTASISVEDLLKTQQVLGNKTKSKHMCCDIYCYKIGSFSELTANSLENFWWEQNPGKT